ncbi:MAG: NYN domain-containing protein, partial [Nevskiales bacterium]
CYTKSHVDIFVVISGDSDFSPLVSKLRENDKTVIGVGVKNSTSDLLMSNCDEFIFYDDLVRQQQQQQKKQQGRKVAPKAEAKQGEKPAEKSQEEKTREAFDLVQETLEALVAERDDDEKIWGSMIKQAIKRRHPGFAESYYGFRSFNALLEAMAKASLLKLTRDERSGGFLVTVGKD